MKICPGTDRCTSASDTKRTQLFLIENNNGGHFGISAAFILSESFANILLQEKEQ